MYCPNCGYKNDEDADFCEHCGSRLEPGDGSEPSPGKKRGNLIVAVRDAESILGNCNVAVAVPGGEVKIPNALLLTRLNTMLTLKMGDKTVDFHLWIEPSSPDTFR